MLHFILVLGRLVKQIDSSRSCGWLAVALLAVGLMGQFAHAETYSWNLIAGNWNTDKWLPSGVPNGQGAGVALLADSGAITTTLDINATVGTIQSLSLGDSQTIASSGSNYLTLDNTGGSPNSFKNQTAAIQQQYQGSLNIYPDIHIKKDLIISIDPDSDGSLKIYGNIINDGSSTGILYLKNPGLGGRINIAGNIGVLAGSSSQTITISSDLGSSGNPVNLSGILGSYVGGINISSNTVTLSGSSANTNTGLTTVSGGELDLGKSVSVNAIGGNLQINGGAVKLLARDQIGNTATVMIASGGTFNLNGFNETVDTFSITGGTLTGTGSTLTASTYALNGGVVSANLGTGSLTANSGVTLLSGTCGVTTFRVVGGTLQLGNNRALGTGSVAADAGTIDLAGYSPTVMTLSGSAGAITNSGSAESILTVHQSATTTFGGSLTDGVKKVALSLTGPGTLILSGTNSYTGGTIVNAGTLLITRSSALPDGMSLTVGAGGVLIFDPSRFSASPMVLSAASPTTLQINSVPEPSTLALSFAGLVVGLSRWRKAKAFQRWFAHSCAKS